MSAVVVLVPTVIAAWPAITSAVVGAATAMGYSAAAKNKKDKQALQNETTVEIEVKNSNIITEGLGSEDNLVFQKGDITVTFYKDQRGSCGIQVCGEGHTEAELTDIGTEISQKVVQQYVYNKLKTELKNKDFVILDEDVEDNKTIKINVRRWE